MAFRQSGWKNYNRMANFLTSTTKARIRNSSRLMNLNSVLEKNVHQRIEWRPFLEEFWYGPYRMAIVSLIPRDCALLVEWPSTWTHDRPLWLKKPSTIVLDRSLWLKWPFSLAQMTVQFGSRPSTFARLSILRTVHFGPDSLWIPNCLKWQSNEK